MNIFHGCIPSLERELFLLGNIVQESNNNLSLRFNRTNRERTVLCNTHFKFITGLQSNDCQYGNDCKFIHDNSVDDMWKKIVRICRIKECLRNSTREVKDYDIKFDKLKNTEITV